MCLLPLIVLLGSALLDSYSHATKHSDRVDCSFDHSTSTADSGFCQWQPDHDGALLWRTGNAVLVDAANSVVRSSTGGERFAFVQGRYGLPTEGRIQSPLINDSFGEPKDLQLSYWKAATGPTLDICLQDTSMKNDEEINCIDSITGPGQQQWIRRCVGLPHSDLPFRIVLKARRILSPEDIVCIDDIRLISTPNGDETTLRKGWDSGGLIANEQSAGHQRIDDDERRGMSRHESLVPFQKVANPNDIRSGWGTPTPPRQKAASLARPQTLKHEKLTAKIHSDHPLVFKGDNGFPEFPSFSDGLSPNPALKRPPYPPQLPDKTAPTQYCKAVKCSFVADTCLW